MSHRWALAGVLVLVGAVACLAFAQSRREIVTSRRIAALLEQLDTQSLSLSVLEWQAIAIGRITPELEVALRDRTAQLRRSLQSLDRESVAHPTLRRVDAGFHSYLAAMREEFRLIGANRLGEARALDAAHVDPAFDRLRVALAHAENAERERNQAAVRRSDAAVAALLLGAIILIGLLFWRYERARGTAAVVRTRLAALEESDKRLKVLLEKSADAIVILRPDSTISHVVGSTSGILGSEPEALLGKVALDLLHPGERAGARMLLERCVSEAGRIEIAEVRARHLDGSWRRLEIVGTNRLDVPGIEGVILNVRDVTARRRADEALRESELRYRILFDRNPQPMWLFDLESQAFLAVNQAAVRHYGYSPDEFLGMTIRDIRPPEDVPRLMEVLAHLPPAGGPAGAWRHLRKGGSLIEVEIVSHRLELGGRQVGLTIATDVTERLRLEAQYRQAQKMEAVGRLAGGVAHDFNNLLTAVLGYAEMLRRDLRQEPGLLHSVEEIQRAGERAATLTRQLLAFSRKQMLQPAVTDLNALVNGISSLLRRLLGEDVRLVTALGARLDSVLVDPGQMDQVVMNLAVNARDAMPDGGTLTLETSNVVLGPEVAASSPEVAPGAYVMLAVTDTGCGMSPEVRSRIFEPFFTTKEQGKGTGLGLATVDGIVHQSGGHLQVSSELGRGATLRIYLPRHAAEETAAPAHEEPCATVVGNEGILLVEDEELVRSLARDVLTRQGYRVLEAADGPAALSLFEQHGDGISLLLTDVVMPRMSGPDLAGVLCARRPDLKLLFTSGYPERGAVGTAALDPDAAFLQKPFTPDDLAQKVREVLDAA